jgi:hypothetical protein
MSESVKIDVHKTFNKYHLDCLFKTNCLVRMFIQICRLGDNVAGWQYLQQEW